MEKIRKKNVGKIFTLRILTALFFTASLGAGYQYIEGLKEDANQKSLATSIAYIGQNLLRASNSAVDRVDDASFSTLSDEQERFTYDVGVIIKGGTLPDGSIIPAPNDTQNNQINALKDVSNDISNNINFIINEKTDLMNLKNSISRYNNIVKNIMNETKTLASMDGIDSAPQIQIELAKIYTDLGSIDATSFGDDRDILNDDYLTNQTATAQMLLGHVKELASLSSQVARLPNAENLTKEANNLYSMSQDFKDNINQIISMLPNRITAKKYVSNADVISDRLSSAYTSLNFVLSNTQSNYQMWLYVNIATVLAFILFSLMLLKVEINSNIKVDSSYNSKTKREFTEKFESALNKFFNQNGKFNRNIQIDVPYSKAYSTSLMKLRDISLYMEKERTMFQSYIRDLQVQGSNMKTLSHNIKEEDFNNGYKLKADVIDNIKFTISVLEDNDKKTQNLEIDTIQVNDSIKKTSSTILKMKRIKESMQESAKRVKKLGESSQSISDFTEEVRSISGKLQVIALNSSIVANESNGDSNKKFSAFSTQIEKMAEELMEIINKADETLKDILKNSQQTIKSVEMTSKEVLNGSDLILEVHQFLTDYEISLRESKRKVNEVLKVNQNSLNSLNKSYSVLKQIDSGREDLNSKKTTLNIQMDSMTEKLAEFLKELNY